MLMIAAPVDVHSIGRHSGDTMQPLLVEIISEGPHCVPCEYAIAAVEYVSESYRNRIEVRIVETRRPSDAVRYLHLCKTHGGILPMPSILFGGRLVFDEIPGPEDLRLALDAALAERERSQ